MKNTTHQAPSLDNLLPSGMIASRSWLLANGLSKDRLDNHVKSGRLRKLARGIYCHYYSTLTWQNVVASFSQYMDIPAYAGGITALEHFGFSQYLKLHDERLVEVYSTLPEPKWLKELTSHLSGITFRWHKTQRIWKSSSVEKPLGVFSQVWSATNYAQAMATPERAFMELLQDVPERVSFEHADEIMQSLTILSPRKIKNLLEACNSVKAKRLFFWFANRHMYSWWSNLDYRKFDLGKGKRVIQKGGRLDSRYLITVPDDMHQTYSIHEALK